jgi:hypothetical protein
VHRRAARVLLLLLLVFALFALWLWLVWLWFVQKTPAGDRRDRDGPS